MSIGSQQTHRLARPASASAMIVALVFLAGPLLIFTLFFALSMVATILLPVAAVARSEWPANAWMAPSMMFVTGLPTWFLWRVARRTVAALRGREVKPIISPRLMPYVALGLGATMVVAALGSLLVAPATGGNATRVVMFTLPYGVLFTAFGVQALRRRRGSGDADVASA